MSAVALMLAATLAGSPAALAEEDAVRVLAAGSLREVMTEMAGQFRAAKGLNVKVTFGASGLLRERIERGEAADVFASADVQNAQRLSDAGRSGPPNLFAHNQLCALVAPGVDVSTSTLLDRMLDTAVSLGTSTPKSDPSGDYAWQLFEKAEALQPGAYAILDRKARKLTGGPDSPQPPPDRSLYGILVAERKADIFLTYCTNATIAAQEVQGARVLALPPPLAVGASYALVVTTDANAAAQRFALYVLSVPGQRILARHGFTPVALP